MSETTFEIDKYYDYKTYLVRDFYTAIIYLNQFKKTQSTGGYLHIPYFMPSGTIRPNATYITNAETRRYKCTDMYIFKKSHNIRMDTSFDGELVIEMIPTTNSADKLYMVYLLKNSIPTNLTELDELIKTSISPPQHFDIMNLTLNALTASKNKKIMYMSGNDRVIIDTVPITVAEIDFSGYSEITQQLFSIYPVNGKYDIIDTHDIHTANSDSTTTKESFIENFKEGQNNDTVGNDITSEMDCVPIDMDDNAISTNTATLLVDGKIGDIINQSSLILTFFLFITTIFASYFLSPLAFQKIVESNVSTKEGVSIATAGISLILIVLASLLLFTTIDEKKLIEVFDNNYIDKLKKFVALQQYIGVLIFLFWVTSMLTVALDRAYRKADPIISMSSIGWDPMVLCVKAFLFPNGEWMHHIIALSIIAGGLLPLLLLIRYDKKDGVNAVPEPNQKNIQKYVCIGASIAYVLWVLIFFVSKNTP